jgi:AcrR family transcriptional regulator
VAGSEIRQRWPAAERRRQLIEAAATLFADRGFGVPTRAIAAELGITQAALYRHFPSKESLVAAVYDTLVTGRWDDAWTGWLADRSGTADGLIRFYQAYVGGFSARSLRLFVRGGLEGRGTADRRRDQLTDRILLPVTAMVRSAAGLPDFAAVPALAGERELALQLHGGLVFLGIRKFIYGQPLPDRLDDLVDLHIRVWWAGAAAGLAWLHQAAPAALSEALTAGRSPATPPRSP